MKQKGLAPIVIVILIAVLAVGGYLIYSQLPKPTTPPRLTIQPTPAPSSTPTSTPESTNSAETANPDSIGANWKAYTNTDGKYSIKYPPSYSLEETDSIKTPEKFPAGKKQIAIKPSDQKLNFIIYVDYYPVPDSSQTNEVIQQVSGCDSVKAQKINHAPKGQDFIIDNQKAIMYEDSLCAQFTAANFYISHNDRVYSISVVSTEKYIQHQTRVNQILSTFKFTP